MITEKEIAFHALAMSVKAQESLLLNIANLIKDTLPQAYAGDLHAYVSNYSNAMEAIEKDFDNAARAVNKQVDNKEK